jgi:tetratricopeptide (TPR) repeat protein
VISFRPFQHGIGVVLAVAVMASPFSAIAQTPASQEHLRVSSSGSYLAARHATIERDAAEAAAYYRSTLRYDPKNSDLLERSFLSDLANGEMEEAFRLAERLIQSDRNNRIARLVLGVRAIKQKQYQTARQQLAQPVRVPIADLTAALLNAWALYGSSETRSALEGIERLTGPDWYAIFKDLHVGMIQDLAGNKKEAGKRLEEAAKLDPNNGTRAVEAYGRWASRNLGKQEGLKVFRDFEKLIPRHPLIIQAIDSLNRGEKLSPLAETVQAGAAEVLYGLGALLSRQGGEDLALIYLQLASYLDPSQPLSQLALAELYETLKKPQFAIKVYQQVPESSPLRRNADIQLALNLDASDRTDEAKKILDKLVAKNATDADAIMALGNVLRGRKQFAECADAYGKSIATISNPQKSNWLTFYYRGICFERSKQWDKAETDLKKALELYPDQPQVLNYLGYSWIDRGEHLDEGMRMIRRAVEQRPDDGFIVDSLGWAYFRVANYDEAVANLERAVKRQPEDPTINDHLGDAYWKVGRTLEAQFQWAHARDLKPEPEELPRIEQKLKSGLPEDTASSADPTKSKKPGDGG